MIFDGAEPDWVETDAAVNWDMPKYNLSARFHRVRAVTRPKGASGQIAGFRDGIAVASCVMPMQSSKS